MIKQRRVNIPMCLAGVLFCLTMISIHLTSGLYAKYTTKSGAEDAARVAKFDVTEESPLLTKNIMFEIRPGEFEYLVEVNNNSEVAINYTITVSNTSKNIPLNFQIEDGEPGVNTVQASQYLKANETQTYSVKILWNADGALDYMGMVDLIRISVEAIQVD